MAITEEPIRGKVYSVKLIDEAGTMLSDFMGTLENVLSLTAALLKEPSLKEMNSYIKNTNAPLDSNTTVYHFIVGGKDVYIISDWVSTLDVKTYIVSTLVMEDVPDEVTGVIKDILATYNVTYRLSVS